MAHDTNRLQLIIISNEVNGLKKMSLTLFKVLQDTQSYQSQTVGPSVNHDKGFSFNEAASVSSARKGKAAGRA